MEGVILEGIVPARTRRGAADVRAEFWGHVMMKDDEEPKRKEEI
jgi:hypothetical protein